MAIGIQAFRNVAGAGGNASIKIDSKKSKGDDVVLKTFGGGKSGIGRLLRNSDGAFAKLYSFVKDPSGTSNKRIRQQFVDAYVNAFPGSADKVRELINPESRKPLSVHLVRQLIDEGESQKVRSDFDCGHGLTISHSSFKTQEQLVSSFTTFVDKTGLNKDGSRLLRLMASADDTLMKEDQEYPRLSYEAKEYKRSNAIRHDNYGGDLLRCSGQIGSATVNVPKTVLRDPTEDRVNHVAVSFDNMLEQIPDNAFELIPDFGQLLDLSMACKHLDGMNQFAKNLVSAAQNGNENGVKQAGQQLLERTSEIVDLLDKTIAGLLSPNVREAFVSDALANPLEYGETAKKNLGLEHYYSMVSGLQAIRRGIMDPDRSFHGLIALGSVAITRPELVIDKLSPKVEVEKHVDVCLEQKTEPTVLVEHDISTLIGTDDDVTVVEPRQTFVEIQEKTLDDL